MVGDGYLFENVKELVVSKGLQNRLHLLGAHPNAVELLADATILMMPSAYEGVALVSYEAMGLGIPQVFADVGGQSELITRDTGMLIQNGGGEEARYAKACLELLSDPDRREKMATAAKSRIQLHFSAANAAREYSRIFEELARDSRKRAAEHGNLRPPHLSPIHLLSH
jgi:glycosyltransferase involved in cell wall biosynthesis